MTRDEAIAIRTRQLQGEKVPNIQLAQAMEVIRRTSLPAPPADQQRRQSTSLGRPFALSKQQMAVVDGLARGETAIEVAQRLNCSESAVRTQLHRARLKMDVATTEHVMALWRQCLAEQAREAA